MHVPQQQHEPIHNGHTSHSYPRPSLVHQLKRFCRHFSDPHHLWTCIKVFVQSSLALVGGILFWLAIWELADKHVFNKTIGRDIIYVIISTVAMVVCDTYLENANAVRANERNLHAAPGADGAASDSDSEEHALSSFAHSEPHSPWYSSRSCSLLLNEFCTFHMIVMVYIRSLVSLTFSIVYWVAWYNLLDAFFYLISGDIELLKNIICLIVGILIMYKCNVLLDEAGLQTKEDEMLEAQLRQQQLIAGPAAWQHSLCVGTPAYRFRRYTFATVALIGAMTYWIGSWELIESITDTTERSAKDPSKGRSIAFIICGLFGLLLTDTVSAQAGIDEDEENFQKRREMRRRSSTVGHGVPPAASMPQQRSDGSSPRSANGSSNGHLSIIPPSDQPAVMPPTTPRRTHRTPRYQLWVRAIVCLFCGMLVWVGVWDVAFSTEVEDSGVEPLLVYAFVGLFLLLITNSLFNNGGVIPPLSIIKFEIARKIHLEELSEQEARELEEEEKRRAIYPPISDNQPSNHQHTNGNVPLAVSPYLIDVEHVISDQLQDEQHDLDDSHPHTYAHVSYADKPAGTHAHSNGAVDARISNGAAQADEEYYSPSPRGALGASSSRYSSVLVDGDAHEVHDVELESDHQYADHRAGQRHEEMQRLQ